MKREVIDEIRRVRQILAEAAQRLQTPTTDSVVGCADRLDEAVDRIVDIEIHAGMVPDEDRRDVMQEMHGLRRELHTIGRLLAQAAQLQIGWARLIGAMPSTYDAHGTMGEPVGSTMKLEG